MLVGHSSGSVSNSIYMATTHDARVKAMVHFAPTAEGSGWMKRSMGEDRYASVVARLQKLVAEGHGDQPVYEDHHLAPPAPPQFTYGYLMTASTWLSWWGPESTNRNIDYFPKIEVPILMISGDADIFVSRAYQEALRRAATASPRVDSITLEGGIPHEFTGAETKASALAFDWLADIGIRPLPRVSTRVVDLRFNAYDVRPSVIYEPTDTALRKPMAVMLMPDFADDVMLTPLDAIGPRLARAGYTVLIAQDRGSGWPFSRAVASGVTGDQQAWLKYLADQGHADVAIVVHGWAGVMVPALLAGPTAPRITGVALIQPPTAPSRFASDAVGPRAYADAVDQAEAAVKRGEGGTAMVIVPWRDPAAHRWINHMAAGFLSFWGPAAAGAPVPALRAAGKPVLLIDAGQGRFLARDVESAAAQKDGASSLWYDAVASPFDAPDRLAGDLASWLDGLLPKPPAASKN